MIGHVWTIASKYGDGLEDPMAQLKDGPLPMRSRGRYGYEMEILNGPRMGETRLIPLASIRSKPKDSIVAATMAAAGQGARSVSNLVDRCDDDLRAAGSKSSMYATRSNSVVTIELHGADVRFLSQITDLLLDGAVETANG